VAKIFPMIWLTLVTLVIVFGCAVQLRWTENMIQAQQHFIDISHKDSMRAEENISAKFKSIYENLRTLSYLPGVRSLDKRGTALSEESRVTFQQIYNNLALNLAVSEVYVVPVDLDPNKIDPTTLRPEAPIVMFDELILNAGSGLSKLERLMAPDKLGHKSLNGPAELETFEYQQLAEQQLWFKSKFGSIDKVKAFDLPFISSREIVTCDNTQFVKTRLEKDRLGIIFSVPYYGVDGNLKGSISAVLLSNRLKDLLPSGNLALVNKNNGYLISSLSSSGLAGSQQFAASNRTDPSLIYSEVIPISVLDNRSPWTVWAGMPNTSFNNSEVVKTANQTRWREFLSLAGLSLAAAISVYLVQLNLSQATRLNQVMEKERDHSAKTEAEARQSSEMLQVLNSDISRLNNDLAEKIKLLTQAQEDIVQKGKMAQLGNLVATVAHELRNPLGGVRTTTFLLRRKLKDSAVDVETQLERIELGVSRCDNIISQLLDFSRSQPLLTEERDVNIWLTELLKEESAKLNENITIRCVLSKTELFAEIDPERLRRGVINLLTNAADAMVGKSGTNLVGPDHKPEISVTLMKTDRGVEIEVRDNGPGIAPEVLSRISEPLFTTKSFGTGLGLAAVRKVAEMHLGGLDISSEFGMGACFRIWLPARKENTIAA
jgi:signal transduction histidine kinase